MTSDMSSFPRNDVADELSAKFSNGLVH